ncbi:hypothetical protein HDU88_004444 [Geranomyces variabilis]|nr:hypothetical protein HDU88_004444 [Geranomyces variabilis]
MPRVRILTLNFFLRPPGISEKNSQGDWKNERLELFAQREFPNYDIIAFQETFLSLSTRRATLIRLAAEQGLVHVAAGKSQPIWRLKVDAGLLVVSRFPVVATDEWTFGRGTEIGDWLAAKGVLYARIRLPRENDDVVDEDRHLHLFSTHFQSTDSPRAKELRMRQFFEAKRFIDRKLGCDADGKNCGKKPQDAVLFVGDMNVDARKSAEDGKNHADEYLRMLDIYSGRAMDPAACPGEGGGDGSLNFFVNDVAHDALGEHPITTSRLRVGPGHPEPDKKCIDFILDFAPRDAFKAAAESGIIDAPPPVVAYENVRVEKFLIDGQPFSSLSDHFGVAADMMW